MMTDFNRIEYRHTKKNMEFMSDDMKSYIKRLLVIRARHIKKSIKHSNKRQHMRAQYHYDRAESIENVLSYADIEIKRF